MNPNPYDPPGVPCEPADDIVDRGERTALRSVICRFLSDEVTAFEFDELLDDFRDSHDSAVRFVAEAVWFHYDDCDDHLVALSKPEWDYFQRLLLLLDSDRHVATVESRRWSASQLLALAGVLCFLTVASVWGWGYHLLLATIPLGCISIAISWRRSEATEVGPYEQIIFPFSTFADLRSAHDSVAFRKVRYPREMQSRRIRSPFMTALYQLQFYASWLILSPIALGFQMFPLRATQARVIAA